MRLLGVFGLVILCVIGVVQSRDVLSVRTWLRGSTANPKVFPHDICIIQYACYRKSNTDPECLPVPELETIKMQHPEISLKSLNMGPKTKESDTSKDISKDASTASKDEDDKGPVSHSRHLVRASYNNVPKFVPKSVQDKIDYASYHGYRYLFIDDIVTPNRGGAWGKLLGVIAAINAGCNYVVYFDMDVIMMNPFAKLEPRIELGTENGADVFLSQDMNGINSGVMGFKGNEWVKDWLRYVYDTASGEAIRHPWQEQKGLMDWMDAHPEESSSHIKYLPQRSWNAYSSHTPGTNPSVNSWNAGDLLVHFPGCGDQTGRDCEREFDEYWKMRTILPRGLMKTRSTQ